MATKTFGKIPPGSFPRARCAACNVLQLPRDTGQYVATATLEAQMKPSITLCLAPCGRDAENHPEILARRIDLPHTFREGK